MSTSLTNLELFSLGRIWGRSLPLRQLLIRPGAAQGVPIRGAKAPAHWRHVSIERAVGRGRQGLTTLAILALTSASSLEAQVGFSSSIAQVALVARSAPRASMQAVSRVRETDHQGQMQNAAVSVRLSANSSYRLVVRGISAQPTSRVWVRTVDGDYQEVVAGSSVTVARGAHSAGQLDREVSYRIESDAVDGPLELPVRYEIVMDPAI